MTLFDKLKVAAIGAVMAALAGGVSFLADFDWSAVDPRWGVAAGAAFSTLLGIIKKERTGYGAGVPKPSDAIPGGSPLPTGAIDETPPA